MNGSTSAESNTTGEHIYKMLTPFPKKKQKVLQQKIVSSRASSEEFQNQQEGLTCLNDSMTITPLPKTSKESKYEKFFIKIERDFAPLDVSLSYLLNHMYWHAGYKLYQCRFCTFLSLYFASMVRHSHIHAGDKPYSCELCQAAFTSTSGLERHRRIHVGTETCQGQQPDCLRFSE
uniref:C2H2-type domain-containing protein n=1 Tax=Malurus cyaneus samueli TaxID=2593467 RepID=A0A8C5T7Y1_9PASS